MLAQSYIQLRIMDKVGALFSNFEAVAQGTQCRVFFLGREEHRQRHSLQAFSCNYQPCMGMILPTSNP